MRLNNDRQNIESAIIFLLEKRSFRLDNKIPMENESDFLIAFLLLVIKSTVFSKDIWKGLFIVLNNISFLIKLYSLH